MKRNTFQRIIGLGALAALVNMAPQAALAGKPATSTQTAQSIMVDLKAEGTFTIVQEKTYKYNQVAAADYFVNAWDGQTPAGILTGKNQPIATSVVNVPLSPVPVTEPEPTPAAPAAPAAPAPDASKLLNNQNPGKEDVVGRNQCAFLDGTALTGDTYTQTATATAQASYISGVKPVKDKGVIVSYDVTTTTVEATYTYTYTYNVAPLQPNYDPLTAWDFVGSTGGDTALVAINADIAGESVMSSKQYAKKYSFSLNPVYDPTTGQEISSRVQNLVVMVDGTPVVAPGSIVHYPVDFDYTATPGLVNGTAQGLLVDGDARTILNTDSFDGNNNGGADGAALALATMDEVQLNLAPGVHTVTLTGVVKDNSAVADLSFALEAVVTVVTPGCGRGSTNP